MIVPSGRAAVLAGAAALPAFAIAVAWPAYWYAGLFLVALVLALVVVDAVATPPQDRSDVRLIAADSAYVGQSVELSLASARAAQTRIEHDERLLPLASDGAVHSFEAVRRGLARIDAFWVRWPGPFGMVWRQMRVPLDRTMAIVPDIRPARAEALRLFRRDMPMGETVQLDRGAGSEFQALAEFRPGMDRRAIDWKRSAHHSKLLAKEYRIERNNDIVFAIDAGRTMCEPVAGLPRVDRAVSAALSAAFVALKLGDKVSLFGFDARPRVASGALSGAANFSVFQRLAAQIDYSTEEANFTLALTTLGARLVRRSLVLVFTDIADPTSAELMLRAVARLSSRHLVLFVLMRDGELETLVDAEPLAIQDVSRAVVAASLLRERRIVIARLQRLGVHVVEAPYEQLGTELVNAYLDMKRRDRL
ncbi:MAG: DUF58 domain-containing protein [Sphingomonadaceae bacterium]